MQDLGRDIILSVVDGSKSIVVGSDDFTITNTIPTSVGSTSHGHLFLVY